MSHSYMICLNNIFPHKDRSIEIDLPIRVYRNLNKRKDNIKWYSILQNSKVVAHTTELTLKNCIFIVNQKGRERVLKNGRKEVHAFIEGTISNDLPTYTDKTISYNPFKNEKFITSSGDFVTQCTHCFILQDGIYID